MTRQRAYQRRHRARGLCELCPRPALLVRHCARHILAERSRHRAEYGHGAWAVGSRGVVPTHTDAELEAIVAREDAAKLLEADRVRAWADCVWLAEATRRFTPGGG